MEKRTILNTAQIELKLKRMALQLAERNLNQEGIVLAGIAPHGTLLVQKLKPLLQKHYKGSIETLEIELDKKHPAEIKLSEGYEFRLPALVIVDDVANSGRTLTYALKPFLQYQFATIQTLVLVDRTHKAFPIQPDYVGLSLATTFQEYIDVEVNEGEITAAWAA